MTREGKAEAALDLLGERLFIAVAGDSARVSATLSVATAMMNSRAPDQDILRQWFDSPCDAFDGKAPIEVLATADIEYLQRVTALLIVAARGF